jgi:hypothetical protein
LLRPFELRDQRVFWRSDEDARAEEIPFHPAAHLLDGKRACFADDEVGLPRCGHVDDVELGAPLERLEGSVAICVVFVGRRIVGKASQRRGQRIDDEVEVLAATRDPMKRARERADHHVGDARAGQLGR